MVTKHILSSYQNPTMKSFESYLSFERARPQRFSTPTYP